MVVNLHDVGLIKCAKFQGLQFYGGSRISQFFILIFACVLQQCSVTALFVIKQKFNVKTRLASKKYDELRINNTNKIITCVM